MGYATSQELAKERAERRHGDSGDSSWYKEPQLAYQPDYYVWAKAAGALGMSLKALNDLEEPERSVMFNWGLSVLNSEAEAERVSAEFRTFKQRAASANNSIN